MNRVSVARSIFVGLLIMLFPTGLVRPLVNLMGHCISRGSRVGFSWLFCDFIGLDEGSRIGHFNVVVVRRLLLRQKALLGRANLLKGPLNVLLKDCAAIGSENRILRARTGITSGPAQLLLGNLAKITASHRVDCAQSVSIGEFSTLAGAGSQIWTHGYVHELEGKGRYRLDGRVEIEDNVYIGSACFISMGVRIVKGVIVGGGTSISRSLLEPGLYVSAPVRHLDRPASPDTRSDLQRVHDPKLCEVVFRKSRS